MATERRDAIEEYPPGPGQPNTLDGWGEWCRFRDEHESERRARRLEAERARTNGPLVPR
jgi:hypothetical protein